jgi:hypothetical protein
MAAMKTNAQGIDFLSSYGPLFRMQVLIWLVSGDETKDILHITNSTF